MKKEAESLAEGYHAALAWADPEIAAQPIVAASIVNKLMMTSGPGAMIPHRDVAEILIPLYLARKERESRTSGQ